ncbi:MAG: M48 family metalloprotease [Acidobacteria bacterium]|nr:M48 family metalloprotease [Acidobacteriota bacterium]MBV9477717.1 M48 family metalloprotease [Acidobacteriota bacterium]
MIASLTAWSVTYLVHSTLFVVVAALAARWIRSASARDTLWKLALAGALVTATLQSSLPPERVLPARAPRRITMPVPAALAPVAERVSAAPSQRAQSQPAQSQSAAPVTRPVSPQPQSARATSFSLLATFWIAGALLFLGRIVLGRARFLRAIGDRVELVAGPERELLDRLSGVALRARPVRLTESRAIQSPIAMIGWEIVLPAGVFPRLSDEQRETILAHELAHLLRRDPLWLTIAEVIKALLFFQPLNWLVQAKMKETAEFLCDDAAVLQTGNGKALAETLAELAAHVVPTTPAVAAMAEGGSNLIARVTRVLRSARPDRPLRLHVHAALALGLLALMALFAPACVPALTSAVASPRVQVLTSMTTAAATPRVVLETSTPQIALAQPVATTRHATSTRTLDAAHANHFSDAELSHTYDGSEGHAHILFRAHDAWIALDGSDVELEDSGAYVRVRYDSERGPGRTVDITRDRRGDLVRHYTIDGDEQPWSRDAERLLSAAFHTTNIDFAARDDGRPPLSTWNANVEYEGTRDGQPVYIRVQATNVKFDDATGAIDTRDSGAIFVEERLGGRDRTYRLEDGRAEWHCSEGNFTPGERADWLRVLLRHNTDLPASVIDNLARR